MEDQSNLNKQEASATAVSVQAKTSEENNAEYVEAEEFYDYAADDRAAWRAQAKKDILWGSVWCVGGLLLTLAHIGFIFWGAILFGGIQLVKGLSNYFKNQ